MKKKTFYDYFFVCALSQIYTFSFFFRQAIAPITDVLEEDFHATTSQIGLCSSLLFAGYFSMQIPSGIILQKYSIEFTSLICSFLMGICSVSFALSPNIEIATITQFLAGIAQAPIAISVLSILDRRMGSNSVSFGFGIVKFYSYFALIGIQYIQAYIYDTYFVWKPIFYVCSVGCIFISILTLFVLILESSNSKIDFKEKVRNDSISMQKVRNDSKPFSQNTPLIDDNDKHNSETLKCILFPIKNSNKIDSNSVRTSLKYAIKNSINFIFAAYGFLLVFILYGFYGLWLISYLMIKFDYKRPTATLISSSFYISSAISGTIWGYLSTKYHKRKIFLIFGVIFMSSSLITIYVTNSMSMIIIAASSIAAGIGFGGQNPVFWAAVRENNSYYHCCDIAVGVINSITNSSGFISQYLIGILMDIHWKHIRGGNDFDNIGDRKYNMSDYDFGFITIPACLVGAFICVLFIKETHGKPVDYSNMTTI